MNNDELKHYGVLGMHWGKRKGSSNSTPSDRQIKKSRRKDVKNRRKMSDQELVEKIGRLEKEKKLRDLTNEEINPGKKMTSDILKSSGTKVATTVVGGATLYAIK